MAGFVVRGAASFALRDDDVARGPELNLLQRVGQVALGDVGPAAAGREQRRLVHQIGEVGARHARRRSGEFVQVHVRRERNLAGVDAQDFGAALAGLAGGP